MTMLQLQLHNNMPQPSTVILVLNFVHNYCLQSSPSILQMSIIIPTSYHHLYLALVFLFTICHPIPLMLPSCPSQNQNLSMSIVINILSPCLSIQSLQNKLNTFFELIIQISNGHRSLKLPSCQIKCVKTTNNSFSMILHTCTCHVCIMQCAQIHTCMNSIFMSVYVHSVPIITTFNPY